MSPMKQDILERLIKLEIDETFLEPKDYLPYTSDDSQDCYIISTAVKPDIAQQYYAGRLVYACTNYFIGLIERGIIIRHIYAVATTKEGARIAESLGFMPLSDEDEWKRRYQEFRRPYILDLTKEGKSKPIRSYLRYKKNLERRQKRYRRQAMKENNRTV